MSRIVDSKVYLAADRLFNLAATTAAVILFLLAVMITIDVLMRWLIGTSIVGIFEVSQVALLAITFLVLGYVQHAGQQLTVDILSARARGPVAILLALLNSLISLVVFGALLWAGIAEWWNAYSGSYMRRGLIDIPTTIPLGFLVLGTGLVVLALILGLLRDLFAPTDPHRNS
jgi:TRAP-type C4-dicarboxylate transport system permease small subunit